MNTVVFLCALAIAGVCALPAKLPKQTIPEKQDLSFDDITGAIADGVHAVSEFTNQLAPALNLASLFGRDVEAQDLDLTELVNTANQLIQVVSLFGRDVPSATEIQEDWLKDLANIATDVANIAVNVAPLVAAGVALVGRDVEAQDLSVDDVTGAISDVTHAISEFTNSLAPVLSLTSLFGRDVEAQDLSVDDVTGAISEVTHAISEFTNSLGPVLSLTSLFGRDVEAQNVDLNELLTTATQVLQIASLFGRDVPSATEIQEDWLKDLGNIATDLVNIAANVAPAVVAGVALFGRDVEAQNVDVNELLTTATQIIQIASLFGRDVPSATEIQEDWLKDLGNIATDLVNIAANVAPAVAAGVALFGRDVEAQNVDVNELLTTATQIIQIASLFGRDVPSATEIQEGWAEDLLNIGKDLVNIAANVAPAIVAGVALVGRDVEAQDLSVDDVTGAIADVTHAISEFTNSLAPALNLASLFGRDAPAPKLRS